MDSTEILETIDGITDGAEACTEMTLTALSDDLANYQVGAVSIILLALGVLVGIFVFHLFSRRWVS